MNEFFKLMEASYKDNPYHNGIHALDVTNSASFFLENGL
jgi:3',5'-cyclic-nucleotide phosphodiesterase/cAMP-specific phosphodiesterase 4